VSGARHGLRLRRVLRRRAGEYVGIDLDPDYIAFARWRWGNARRRFELVRLEELPDDERFDAAIMASALHHLSDALAHAILARLARMVRSRSSCSTSTPRREPLATPAPRPGPRRIHPASCRAARDPRATLRRHGQRRVVTTTGSAVQVLFVCTPRG